VRIGSDQAASMHRNPAPGILLRVLAQPLSLAIERSVAPAIKDFPLGLREYPREVPTRSTSGQRPSSSETSRRACSTRPRSISIRRSARRFERSAPCSSSLRIDSDIRNPPLRPIRALAAILPRRRTSEQPAFTAPPPG
jgi:hypothetical protein